MKKGIHPENYRPVVFKDMSNDDVFITRSTINAKETIEIDGVTYPLVKVEISNTSHPFYTGKSKLVDTAGGVEICIVAFFCIFAGVNIMKYHGKNERTITKHLGSVPVGRESSFR